MAPDSRLQEGLTWLLSKVGLLLNDHLLICDDYSTLQFANLFTSVHVV